MKIRYLIWRFDLFFILGFESHENSKIRKFVLLFQVFRSGRISINNRMKIKISLIGIKLDLFLNFVQHFRPRVPFFLLNLPGIGVVRLPGRSLLSKAEGSGRGVIICSRKFSSMEMRRGR